MSNKQQLQTNNATLDTLTSKVATAKSIIAAFPSTPTPVECLTIDDALNLLIGADNGDLMMYVGSEFSGEYSYTVTTANGYDDVNYFRLNTEYPLYKAVVVSDAHTGYHRMACWEAVEIFDEEFWKGNLRVIYNDKATSLRKSAYENYANLYAIDLPNVKTIVVDAFYNCTGLECVGAPQVESLQVSAFQACSNLSRIDLPKIKSIGQTVFYNCKNLNTIVIGTEQTSVCSLSNINAFNGTPIASGTGYIYVSDNLVDKYKSATNWTNFSAQIKGISELSW